VGRRVAWFALLWGGPSDWLDGPLARFDGATRLGALLDLEADSWLSLWAGAAAWRTGELPWFGALPPFMRYLGLLAHRRLRGRPERFWQRSAAGLQVVSVGLALAPQSDLRRLGRMLAPFGALAQTLSIAVVTIDARWRRPPFSARPVAPAAADRRAAPGRASA
jgi:phosphatidylglycerophosphate synthase